jgi:ribosomal-protein-alanine N-acetyltransferase
MGDGGWGGRRTPRSRYNVGVSFVVQDSKPEDFETLWRIDQQCFPPGISYSRVELKFYMRRRGAFTLLALRGENGDGGGERQGRIIGFLVAEAGKTGVGHVITIDVVSAARKLGAGSALLSAAERRLRELNCHSVGLETAVDNVAALSFYKRHKYSVVRTWPRYYTNGVDALVLTKELKQQEENTA